MPPRRLPIPIALVLIQAAAVAMADPSSYRAADPTAPAVTAASLPSSERFWPYQVVLESPWQPEGAKAALPAGSIGVLVRVESPERALIHFGRGGRFETPISKTDLVERANRVRTGELQKPAPHFVHTIGTRLVDSASEKIRFVDLADVYAPRAFLAVFADPGGDGFEALAAALAPLREATGVMTVLFPQGDHPDVRTRETLRAAKWPVAFLRDEYGEGYTRSLRGDGAPLPAVMLFTPDGRVVFDRPWGEGVATSLRVALEKEFPATSPAAAAVKQPGRP